MARPAPEIILTKDVAGNTWDIVETPGVWALYYQDRPASFRQQWASVTGLRYKYPRTCFNNHAHCQRLADKLNRIFKTEDFTCKNVLVK